MIDGFENTEKTIGSAICVSFSWGPWWDLFSTDDRDMSKDIAARLLNVAVESIEHHSGSIVWCSGEGTISGLFETQQDPDHALRACLSAREIEAFLDSDEFKIGLGPLSGTLKRVAIGIHSGIMLTGFLGAPESGRRILLSKDSALSCRLTGVATGSYGARVIVTQSIVAAASSSLLFREIDLVQFPHQGAPIEIFELVGRDDDATDETRKRLQVFAEGRADFRNRKWASAREKFARVLQLGNGDEGAEFQLRRCEQFIDYPPPASWDGSFRLMG